jgi:hypothetical protein
MNTQIEFLKEVIRQKITFEYLENAKELYAEIKESVVATNMDEIAFENYASTIFSISDPSFIKKEVVYPGEIRFEYGVSWYFPDVKRAVNNVYKMYRKNEFTERETE